MVLWIQQLQTTTNKMEWNGMEMEMEMEFSIWSAVMNEIF